MRRPLAPAFQLERPATSKRPARLDVAAVSKSFGAVQAVRDVTFSVASGSLVCLIGPNGAGKSTLLHTIAGFHRQNAGRMTLDGVDISNWPPFRRSRAGLGTVFQTTLPVPTLTVRENVMVGAHAWSRKEFIAGVVRPRSQRSEEFAICAAADEALSLVGLADLADRPPDGLPFGQLRLLGVARALAQRPTMLLLDEPAAGLRGPEKERLATVFRALRDRGHTQLVVEHDMQFVASVADRVIVLDGGEVIADGPPQEVRRDAAVVAAYLGTESL